jgi:hypothetical protein
LLLKKTKKIKNFLFIFPIKKNMKDMGTFLALRAKNRAFRSKSSDLPMQILWAFRCNPLRGGSDGPRNCEAISWPAP